MQANNISYWSAWLNLKASLPFKMAPDLHKVFKTCIIGSRFLLTMPYNVQEHNIFLSKKRQWIFGLILLPSCLVILFETVVSPIHGSGGLLASTSYGRKLVTIIGHTTLIFQIVRSSKSLLRIIKDMEEINRMLPLSKEQLRKMLCVVVLQLAFVATVTVSNIYGIANPKPAWSSYQAKANWILVFTDLPCFMTQMHFLDSVGVIGEFFDVFHERMESLIAESWQNPEIVIVADPHLK